MILQAMVLRRWAANFIAIFGVLAILIALYQLFFFANQAVVKNLPAISILYTLAGVLPGDWVPMVVLSACLSILMSYQQLLASNELTAMVSGGFAPRQLLAIGVLPACLVTLLVFVLMGYVRPLGYQQLNLQSQAMNAEHFDFFPTQQFFRTANSWIYIGAKNQQGGRIEEVFIAHDNGTVTVANHGNLEHSGGQSFLILNHGNHYRHTQGQWHHTQFGQFGLTLPPFDNQLKIFSEKYTHTLGELWQSRTQRAHLTQCYFILSLAVFCLLMMRLSFTLCLFLQDGQQMHPKLAMVILFFMYFLLLDGSRKAIEDGASLWWFGVVHGVFLLILTTLNRLRRHLL